MGSLKDIYDILKDLMNNAKTLQNQPMINLSMELQASFFELKEEIEKLKDENRELNKLLEKNIKNEEIEKDLELNVKGYYTRNSEQNKIQYCARCWNIERKLMPLNRQTIKTAKCINCKIIINI